MSTGVTEIVRESWGSFQGDDVFLFRMKNINGSFVEITNYGATIVSIHVPDRDGNVDSVILGYPTLEGYLKDACCIGSTIGRFANRIGGGSFSLDGTRYALDRNDGKNTNHGGAVGFHTRVFNSHISGDELIFTLISEDGEGGFPGRVEFKTTYAWSQSNELTIRFKATTDKPTVVNFTNHAYFNLSSGRTNILAHRLSIDSDRRLEISEDYIPTGRILPAAHLTFSGNTLKSNFTDQGNTGINSYFFFDETESKNYQCTLTEDVTGRVLAVRTSFPGVQTYTGDFLTSVMPGNNGRPHRPFDGVCLECQYCPDSPNHSNFPSTRLDPGQVFKHYIIYKFSLTEGT